MNKQLITNNWRDELRESQTESDRIRDSCNSSFRNNFPPSALCAKRIGASAFQWPAANVRYFFIFLLIYC